MSAVETAMPTQKVSKKKAPQQKQAKGTSRRNPIIDEQLRQHASQVVAAYALLGEWEGRLEDITPGAWRFSIAEQLLLQAGMPWLENNHRIASEMDRIRMARNLLASGVSYDTWMAAQEAHDKSCDALLEAKMAFELVESETPDLVAKYLNGTKKKLDDLKAAESEAREKLAEARKNYDTLLRLAPKPLTEFAEKLTNESHVPGLKSQVADIESRIAAFLVLQQVLQDVDTKKNSDNADMHGTARSILPDAVTPSRGGKGYVIDQTMCHKKAKEYGDEELPGLREELRSTKALLKEEYDRARGPLHRWAETGELTIEMLLVNRA